MILSIEEIILEEREILKRLKQEGIYYKLIMGLAMVPISYVFYLMMSRKNELLDPSKQYTENQILLVTFILGAVLGTLMLVTRPEKYINNRRITRQRKLLKNKLNDYLLETIPELDIYEDWKKIPVQVFKESKLYSQTFTDYEGDDFMRFFYEGSTFYLSELNNFSLFNTIFYGLFGVINLSDELSEEKRNEIKTFHSIQCLKQSGHVEVNTSGKRCYVSLDLGRSVFENKSYDAIELLEEDVTIIQHFVNFHKELTQLSLKK